MKFLVPLVLIATAGGVFFMFVKPQYEQIAVLRASELGYEEAILDAQEIQSLQDKLVTEYNQFTAEEISQIDLLVPSEASYPHLVYDLDVLAKRYGITLRSISASAGSAPSSGEGVVVPQTLTMSFSASYPAFLAFLSDLEESLQLFDVTSVGFAAGTEESAKYDFNIKLTYYSYSE